MKNFLLLSVFVLAAWSVSAQDLHGNMQDRRLPAKSAGEKLQFSLQTGYQQENFHWSIAGNSSGQDPNVYSELKWRRLSGPVMRLALSWNVWRWLSLYADGSRLFITGGKVSDTDYQGDNRQHAIYQGQFDSDKGNTASWSLGAGGCILNSSLFSLSPVLGYGVHYQSMYLVDHSGLYTMLNSSYKTSWKGPYLKILSTLRFNTRLQANADLSYHQVVYNARADWNLINTFSHPVSFRHNANGYGIDLHAGLHYRLTRVLSCSLGGGYFNWQTGKGTDQLFLSAGGSDKTQMNGAFRDGWRVMAGIAAHF